MRMPSYVVYDNEIISTEGGCGIECVVQQFGLNEDTNKPELGKNNYWLSGPNPEDPPLTQEEVDVVIEIVQQAKRANEFIVIRPINVVFSK